MVVWRYAFLAVLSHRNVCVRIQLVHCCRFLDKGLDEVGPKGLDFLTVLAAHEGEGLVVDRWGPHCCLWEHAVEAGNIASDDTTRASYSRCAKCVLLMSNQ